MANLNHIYIYIYIYICMNLHLSVVSFDAGNLCVVNCPSCYNTVCVNKGMQNDCSKDGQCWNGAVYPRIKLRFFKY
jgi:hypothetical protein